MQLYQNYVNSLRHRGFKSLILVPILVGVGIFLMPPFFQVAFSLIFPAPLEQVGSFAGMLAMVATVFLSLFWLNKGFGLRFSNLGLHRARLKSQVSIGFFGGLGLLSFVAVLIWLFGGMSLQYNFTFEAMLPLLIGLIFFLFQGTWEELIFRSYMMPHFSKFMGDKASIFATSVLFTLAHGLNPNMSFLPILNLFIGSLVFSLVYYYTGSLVLVGLGHGMWNFAQGFFFGAEVSGNALPYSVFKSLANKNLPLISGGSFGFEGSIIVSVLGIILCSWFISKMRRQKIK